MTTLAQQLQSAREAYHNLMLGKSARVVVDSDGSRVEYTAANSDKLRSYIQSLEQQIAAGSTGARRNGPLIPFF